MILWQKLMEQNQKNSPPPGGILLDVLQMAYDNYNIRDHCHCIYNLRYAYQGKV